MKSKQIITLLLAASLTLTAVGCASQDGQSADGIPMDDNTAAMEGATRSAPGSMPLNEENSFPYLGMSFSASENLRSAIDTGMVFVEIDGMFQIIQNEDGTYVDNAPLDYGYISFTVIPEEQRSRTPRTDSPDAIEDYDTFVQWLEEDTAPVGRLSVFHTSYLAGKELADLTGMETNTEVGQDGDYRFYYSSTVSGEDLSQETLSLVNAVRDELALLAKSLSVKAPLTMDENYTGFATMERETVANVGDFQTTDLGGNTATSDIFADYDLTVINVWTTWCSPCVGELPHLAELAEELKAQGVQIIGIVNDVVDEKTGEANEETLEMAKVIRDKTGVKYPVLLPDGVLMDGILKGIPGYPETFFVDKNGNIVTDSILGAHSKAEWAQIINDVLTQVKE